jgi:hypothetical protein
VWDAFRTHSRVTVSCLFLTTRFDRKGKTLSANGLEALRVVRHRDSHIV